MPSNEFATHYLAPAEAPANRSTETPLSLLLAAGLILPTLLAYALVTTNETQVLAVMLGLLGVTLILARPSWGLVLFVGLVYVRPEETFPVLAGMRFTLAISLVTLIGLYLQLFVNREMFVRTPVNILLLGFTFTVILSIVGKASISETAEQIVKAVILVPLTLNLIRTPDRYQTLVSALIGFTTYLAVYSIYLYFTGSALQRGDFEQSQATGIFGDPNDLSATLVPGLALSLCRFRQARPAARLSYGLLAATTLWALFLCNSRGGILATLVVIAGFLFVYSRYKVVAIGLAVLITMGAMVAGPGRMSQMDTAEGSANSRFWFWSNAVSHLARNPVRGVGYNLFADLNEGKVAHNTFVQCFVEIGLPGYFLWMGCLYYCFRRRARGDEAGDGTPADEADLVGARLALIGYLAACFWISRTYVPTTYLLISLPLAQQISRSTTPFLFNLSREERIQDAKRIVALSLGSVFLIHLIAIGLR